MQLTVITIIVALLAIACLYAASKLLFSRAWFLNWLKGTVGFGLFALGLFAALGLVDIFSYKNVLNEDTIATISFEKLAPQKFSASVLDGTGGESRFELSGDQWQLDVRMLSWQGPFAAMGVMPAIRLDRLSGRYLSLEQERTLDRTLYSVTESVAFDYWSIMEKMPWMDAKFGSATFMPMADGAIYEVKATARGIMARPLNEVAKVALESW